MKRCLSSRCSCWTSPVLLICCILVFQVKGEDNNSTTHDHANHDHAGPCTPDKTTGKPKDWEAPHEYLKKLTGRVDCTDNDASGYSCDKVHLESFIPLSDLHPGGETLEANDIWGWEDPTNGDEYAFIGLEDGFSFVDISNPASPEVVGYLPRESSTSNSWWGDAKTYKDHVYIVADGSFGSHLQVYDLTQLKNLERGTINTLQTTTLYDGFEKAHNIVINEDSGFAYVVGSNKCGGGLHIVDLNDPKNPVSADCYDYRGYTHDAQCVIYKGPDIKYFNKEICFAFNEDAVDIIDVDDKTNMRFVGTLTYPGVVYTHQGWLTDDHKHVIINDENDSGQTKTFIGDVTKLEAPLHIGTHVSDRTAIDHNLYVKGNYMYQAQYTAGLRIFDLTNVGIGEFEEIGHFDIFPNHDLHTFNGAWSVYPFFKSGVVVVSGIEQGLFVLRPDLNDDGTSLSWNIALVESRVGNIEGKPVIEVLYESSDRDYDVEVFLNDCESPTEVFSKKNERTKSDEEGFMNVEVTLNFDQDELENSPLWEENENGIGGSFSFCMSKSLLASGTVVTRKSTTFRVSVDNQAEFNIIGIAVEEGAVDQEDLLMTYEGTVKAFQCVEETYGRVDDDIVLGPFDILNICVQVEDAETNDVVVSKILDLTITQDDTRVTFIALKNGETDENFADLVSTKCNLDGVCMARVQLYNAFFENIQNLNVAGVVTLGSGSRRLNLPVRTSSSLRGGRSEERNLQEKSEFALTVILAEPCKENEGAKSILREVFSWWP